jgi:LmbE family N-acetylglucosaminyl deacetylase
MRPPSHFRLIPLIGAVAAVLLASAAPAAAVPAAPAQPGRGVAPGPPDRTTSAGPPVDLDTLFVGAHPDDEAGSLSTFGQWDEDLGVRTGVVTVTRGEGGGNAVGPEEGPPLGLLREGEERIAVAKAGIRDVFNLDDVDFYYTVSAPLTEQVWGSDALGTVVRLLRTTRPEVLVTMDPAPSPGNHGNHQQAARLAIEAFYAAADPRAFPEQLTREGLRPWAAGRLLLRSARGTGAVGRSCPAAFQPVDPTQNIYGVWSGTRSARQGKTWAAIEREAQRAYASQGWTGFPDVPSDPEQLGCDYFTQVDARVPFPEPGSAPAAAPTAMLDGALTRAPGTVPVGTTLRLATGGFTVRPGTPFTVDVTVVAPSRRALGRSTVTLRVPEGWQVTGSGALGRIAAGRVAAARFTVTPAAGATTGTRARVAATLATEAGGGYTDRSVEVTPAVRGQQQLLPQVAQFEQWTARVGVPQLRGFVTPVLSLPSGGTRPVAVVLTNASGVSQSGTVRVELPQGFTADRTEATYSGLAPGASTTVQFQVTNSDPALPTSNQGGTPGAEPGNYVYTITTTSSGGSSTSRPALELVPATTVPPAAADPTVDGRESPGEYPGAALDISRLWEGSACSSAADCSGSAKVTWRDDTLFLLVQVADDVLGTRLETADCKRHWRTDSVEVTFDPRGASENTSTTFKAAVLPATAEGPPCFLRDADNRQGPGPQTAPGMRVASSVSSPFTGYTVEMAIPMENLPGAVDPDRLGMNILVYDSDTQDKTGQTRIGWSTWGGVQGDPYRWGRARLAGYTPPPGRPTTPPAPVIPDTALSSLDSPQSLEQAVRINVPLAGDPAAPRGASGWVTGAFRRGGTVLVTLRATAAGRAHLFVRDAEGTAGSRVVTVPGRGATTVRVPLSRSLAGRATVLAGWQATGGGTLASRARVR